MNRNICRICLEDKAALNWIEDIGEFSGISYKNCYYKYSGCQANASDPFPQNLCEICSDGLKNVHLLFEKAKESLKILQDLLITKDETELIITNRYEDDCKPSNISGTESTSTSENVLKVQKEIYASNDHDNECVTNNSKKISTSDGKTIEPRHFMEISHCESSSEELLENNRNKSCDTESSDTRNEDIKGKFLCAYCSLRFNHSWAVKEHEATHNENRKRTITCPTCGIKLYTKRALNNHKLIHVENREKKYQCEFCEKAFFNRGACNIHRRIHLGLMVACPICPKEFYRQIDLDRHLLKHSAAPLQKNSVEMKKYTVLCQYCNETVATTKWKEHKAVHIGQPQVKCKICDKNFFARRTIVRHLRRLHRKTRDEYDKFIHYYVDCRKRMSHLMIKQQELVEPVLK